MKLMKIGQGVQEIWSRQKSVTDGQTVNRPVSQVEKCHGLHDIQVDILKLVYHHPRRFLWAFRTRGEFQGLG